MLIKHNGRPWRKGGSQQVADHDWQGGKQEKLRLYWKVREEGKRSVREKFERLRPHLGERGTRLWAANEALAFGTGGVRAVAEALAISPKTILQGKRELQASADPADRELVGERQRRPGGGRKTILAKIQNCAAGSSSWSIRRRVGIPGSRCAGFRKACLTLRRSWGGKVTHSASPR